MEVNIVSIVEFLLIAAAGYWLVMMFFPQVKKDVLDGLVSNAAMSDGLVKLATISIAALFGAAALTALGAALLGSGIEGYLTAISATLNTVSAGVGVLLSIVTIGAVLYVGQNLVALKK